MNQTSELQRCRRSRSRTWLWTHVGPWLLCLVALSSCRPGGCEPRGSDGSSGDPVERIVLISIDTLRPDHLGIHGHVRPTSPNIDTLAARGTLFEDASTTAPWTLPAHASMLTGLYPVEAGARTRTEALRTDVPTIAARLLDAGFRTMGVANVTWLHFFKLNPGFEKWEYLPADKDAEGDAGRITDMGIEFLEKTATERSFLFLHYFDVHSPYRSRPRFENKFLPRDFRDRSRVTGGSLQLGLAGNEHGYVHFTEAERENLEKLYDAGILQLDFELGRLFRFIEERFGFGDTLVILTSDHGEAFFEHGSYSHGQNQYQELLRVPLIIGGKSVPQGVRVAAPVSLIDIAPTIFAAAGVAIPDSLPGIDLARYWHADEPAPTDRVLYSQSAPPEADTTRMVRRGSFKLIVDFDDGEHELYDLENDPDEQTDLSETRPEQLAELSLLMDQFFGQGSSEDGADIQLDGETIEQLRGLGYME